MKVNLQRDAARTFPAEVLSGNRIKLLNNNKFTRFSQGNRGDSQYNLKVKTVNPVETQWNYQPTVQVLLQGPEGEKEIATGILSSVVLSPLAKHILWWDYSTLKWNVYNIASAQTQTLEAGVNFWEEEDDHPTRPDAYGMAGWLEEDNAVVLYDYYDLWKMPLDGSAPVRLTQGREAGVTYRYINVKDREEERHIGQNETILLSLFSLLWSFPIPIILSLCINQLRFNRYKRVVQTVLYAPHFISIMVVCGMIRIFLSPSGGLINLLLGSSVDFMTQSTAFRTIYIASGIWQDAGWGCIIYLATLSNIDTSLYEAAKVDGATVFQRILNVDIPALLPMAVLMFIMSAGQLMNVGFEKVWLLQTDLNKATSDVIAVYVYQQGIENAKYSYSTAVGLFNTAINLILLFVVNKISKKFSEVDFV